MVSVSIPGERGLDLQQKIKGLPIKRLENKDENVQKSFKKSHPHFKFKRKDRKRESF
jgi:hypothetical protein